jgi:hypothetical protein
MKTAFSWLLLNTAGVSIGPDVTLDPDLDARPKD